MEQPRTPDDFMKIFTAEFARRQGRKPELGERLAMAGVALIPDYSHIRFEDLVTVTPLERKS